MGDQLGHVAHAAEEFAHACGQDCLDGGQTRVLGEDVKDLLHADLIAAENVALSAAAFLAGADDGLGHVAVVGAVEGALDAGGHFALHILLDDAGHIAEGVVAGAGDTAGQDQAAVDLTGVDGVQHQLAGGRLGLVVDADDRVGVEALHLTDDRALGLLRDGAGGADEDQARAVGLALVDDVLSTIHVDMPDLVRHQVADGDHGRAVDAVDRGVLGDIRKERVQRRNIGHVSFIDVGTFGKMAGGFLAAKDKGADSLAVCDQIADDGAAQIAGRAGDDVKLITIFIVIHCIFLHVSWCVVKFFAWDVLRIQEACLCFIGEMFMFC